MVNKYVILSALGFCAYIATVDAASRTLPLEPDDDSFVTVVDVNPDALPRDPGFRGKTTLAGIDTNANGVRDDVEIAIAGKYQEKRDRTLLYNFAKGIQFALLAGSRGAELNSAAAEYMKRFECIQEYLGKSPSESIDFVQQLVVNTPQRESGYAKYYDSQAGKVFQGANPTLEQCLSH